MVSEILKHLTVEGWVNFTLIVIKIISSLFHDYKCKPVLVFNDPECSPYSQMPRTVENQGFLKQNVFSKLYDSGIVY